jgi:hypothetical protein
MCNNKTTSTTASYLPGASQTASQGYSALQSLLPSLSGKVGQGLTSGEKSYYGGQIQKNVNDNTASQIQSYNDQMARQGNMVGRGSIAEGVSGIRRSGVEGMASGLSSLTGMDINQKQQNLQNLLSTLGLAVYPQSSGGTSTTEGGLLSTLTGIRSLIKRG